jgi:DMSO/TMAO reductase YedYZ heme-binding membrane subunit
MPAGIGALAASKTPQAQDAAGGASVLRRRHYPADSESARGHGAAWTLLLVALAVGGAAAGGGAARDRAVLAAVQQFMLAYAGVFALIALTATVAVGLIASDRIIMSPAGRVVAQAVHRALSLAAVGFLATHVVLEVLAHRSRPVDAVAPFLASGRTFYIGLGTLASDLLLLILATGVARRRFATGQPAAWRGVHVTAYLAWPLAVAHGLLAGRQAKPYVDWSYGACLGAVALALLVRWVATTRSRTEVAPQAVPVHGPLPGWASAGYDALGGSSADEIAAAPARLALPGPIQRPPGARGARRDSAGHRTDPR